MNIGNRGLGLFRLLTSKRFVPVYNHVVHPKSWRSEAHLILILLSTYLIIMKTLRVKRPVPCVPEKAGTNVCANISKHILCTFL